jgi:hypothetical protein
MYGALEFFGYGVLVPAAVSFAICWFSQQLLHQGAAERYSAAVAFAVGYCAGFVLLGWPNDVLPTRHWHWTLYLAPAAALLGPIAASKGLALPERWLLLLVGALAAAWVLVPNWPSLQPPRSACVPLLAAYIFLLAALLDPLLERFSAGRGISVLFVTAALIAIATAYFVSLTYAQFAAAAAAALVGCSSAAKVSNARTAHGLALSFAVVVGGWAFIVCIESPEPLAGFLIAPLAPLSLWFCVRGPLSKLRGWAAIGVQFVLVALILAIAGALVVMKAGFQ